jgi:hypothetical protein
MNSKKVFGQSDKASDTARSEAQILTWFNASDLPDDDALTNYKIVSSSVCSAVVPCLKNNFHRNVG